MTSRVRAVNILMCVVAAAVLAVACSGESERVKVGMSREQVETNLGQPDRKAVLIGKTLRDVDELPAGELARHRLVYIYDGPRLQVWFEHDKVSGVTRDGMAAH